MRAEVWLNKASLALEKAGIGSARLDALILLEDEMEKERSFVLAHPELTLSKTKLKRLNAKLKRRQDHQPMAYIRGWSEFFGRRFNVNRHVLEPRPESEDMISLLKKIPLPASPALADVGTGSGCLGITVALEFPRSRVDLYDIDASSLAVAKANMHLHELRLKVYKRDLLQNYARVYDVVMANLPYVPDHFRVNQAAAMEPAIAIFGGLDGLSLYRRLFEQLSHFRWSPKFVLTESLPPQHNSLAKIAAAAGFKLKKTEGFIQLFG